MIQKNVAVREEIIIEYVLTVYHFSCYLQLSAIDKNSEFYERGVCDKSADK